MMLHNLTDFGENDMNHAVSIQGKKIAFLVTDGFEQVELTSPWEAVKNAGGHPILVSIKSGTVQGFHHHDKGDSFPVDEVVSSVEVNDFDGLMLAGGAINPDALRMDEKAVAFVRAFFEQKKPVAAICHAPILLIEADVLRGRNVTSWPSIRTDILNAGGLWYDEEVIVDNGLVTSRKPEDLKAFCSKMLEEFSEGIHQNQAA
jgi:protease I